MGGYISITGLSDIVYVEARACAKPVYCMSSVLVVVRWNEPEERVMAYGGECGCNVIQSALLDLYSMTSISFHVASFDGLAQPIAVAKELLHV